MAGKPELQNQHRVSQVYLRQFGYRSADGWRVSVYQVGNNTTENLDISKFTADHNIFDAPYGDLAFRRNFEIQCSKVENYYPSIISNLHNQKQLTSKNIDALCHFIASLLSRSVPFTDFIRLVLGDNAAKTRFIDEICMFSEKQELLTNTLDVIPIDLQLNTILGTITAHLVEVISCFDFVVLERPTDIKWMTTDNPVVIDRQGDQECLIGPETEIYLPLSGDFCLFGFHDGAKNKSNPFRILQGNRVSKISIEQFDELQKRIGFNHHKYIVTPCYLEDTPIDLSAGKTGFPSAGHDQEIE